VLYTVNVFITFTLSLAGLTRYWWSQRRDAEHGLRRLALSGFALFITAGILVVIVVERFLQGGIITLAITSTVVAAGLLIRRHYARVRRLADELERGRRWQIKELDTAPPDPDPAAATAVFLVGNNRGVGLTMIERVEALFPGHFRNHVYVGVGTVDTESYGSEQSITTLQYETRATLDSLANYSQAHGRSTAWYEGYASDRLLELERLCLVVRERFPNSVYFATRLVFDEDRWWNRWLHSQTPTAIQRILNRHGIELVILPVMLRERGAAGTRQGAARA
jgi:hypothetical protein